MTARTRRKKVAGVQLPVEAPADARDPDTQPGPAPTEPAQVGSVTDRLAVLRAYADGEGLVPVTVMVSHDGVYEGERRRVPVTGRIAGLIEIGYLVVDPPGVEGDR